MFWRVAMQRSSDKIGTLAAALAKAQGELTNPEKSLVATIRPDGRGGPERSFRYAPLSGGLDIVRKVLGQHQIATVQTTAIDETAGIVKLTTMLAHASGEWIASDWPVCRLAATGTPRRMGAALTYARRYALFTLVGIAGEDDLDAPDLPVSVTPAADNGRDQQDAGHSAHSLTNGSDQGRPPAKANQGRPPAHGNQARPIALDPDESALLRDRLLSEVATLSSRDEAATWAHRSLKDKNGLTEPNARSIEDAFAAKLGGWAASNESTLRPVSDATQPQPDSSAEIRKPNAGAPKKKQNKNQQNKTRGRSKAIDKSLLTLPELRRVRDRDHVRFVARQPCLICGRQPADAHHLRFAQHRALARKASDEFTVPLCRGHHHELHRHGDEAAWWQRTGLDPLVMARDLWIKSHRQGLR
jgi:hypothetical protein